MSDGTLGNRYREAESVRRGAAGEWFRATRAEDGAKVLVFAAAAEIDDLDAALAKAIEGAANAASTGSATIGRIGHRSTSPSGSPLVEYEPAIEETLAESLKRGSMSLDHALDVGYQIATALQAAEGTSEPHYDLTAETIGLGRSTDAGMPVVVAGWGLRALLPSYDPKKKDAPFYGSAEYMAPELCSGKPADHRADLYSLGVLLYQLANGKPPFVSSRVATTLKRQVYEKPLPLHLVKPGLDHINEYEKVVLRALEKDPRKRFATAAEMVEALEALRAECFSDMAFTDATKAAAEAARLGPAQAAAEGSGTFEAAAEEDITSQKHGTLVFTGVGEVLEQLEAEEAAAEAAGDDDESFEIDDRSSEGGSWGASASWGDDAAPADDDEPESDEQTVEVEEEASRHKTVVFDAQSGLKAAAAAATEAVETAADENEDSLPWSDQSEDDLDGAADEPEEEEQDDEVAAAAASASVDEPAAAAKPEGDSLTPRSTAKVSADPADAAAALAASATSAEGTAAGGTEGLDGWFVEGANDAAAEPGFGETNTGGSRTALAIAAVLALVVVAAILWMVFGNDGGAKKANDPQSTAGKSEAATSRAETNEAEQKPTETAKAEPEPEPEPEISDAEKFTGLGAEALDRGDLVAARDAFNKALAADADYELAKTGLAAVDKLMAQAKAQEEAAKAEAEAAAAAGKAGEAEQKLEEAAQAEIAAAEKRAAEEEAKRKEVAAALAAEKAAAEKAAAEKAAAEKAAEEQKAVELLAAQKAASEKKAAEDKATAQQAAAEKKAAEKKAAEKKALAKKKAAEKKAAEKRAAAKKASEKKKTVAAAAGTGAAGAAAAAPAPKADTSGDKQADTAKTEEKKDTGDGNVAASKRLVKLGIGALKKGNSELALKYFEKAQKLDPNDKYISKYIQKAKAAN